MMDSIVNDCLSQRIYITSTTPTAHSISHAVLSDCARVIDDFFARSNPDGRFVGRSLRVLADTVAIAWQEGL